MSFKIYKLYLNKSVKNILYPAVNHALENWGRICTYIWGKAIWDGEVAVLENNKIWLQSFGEEVVWPT